MPADDYIWDVLAEKHNGTTTQSFTLVEIKKNHSYTTKKEIYIQYV